MYEKLQYKFLFKVVKGHVVSAITVHTHKTIQISIRNVLTIHYGLQICKIIAVFNSEIYRLFFAYKNKIEIITKLINENSNNKNL